MKMLLRGALQVVARGASPTTRQSAWRSRAGVVLSDRFLIAGSKQSGAQSRTKVTVPGASTGSAERRKRLKPKLSKDKFAALTSTFFERVESAVAPLQPPMNEDFVLERDANGGMTIRTNAKEFEIKVVPLKQQLHFTSPISGVRAYEWNARTQRWEDENDSHDIEGLLTRDLMRICSGIPSF